MELTKIEDIKKEVGNKIMCAKADNLPENLQDKTAFEGVLISGFYTTTFDKEGEKITDYSYNVDVVDPIDHGIHHLSVKRLFSLDSQEADVSNAGIDDELAILAKRQAFLEAQKK
jgi:hypothetical protein